MAPYFEKETLMPEISEKYGRKYVLVNNKIFIADLSEGDRINHSELVKKLAVEEGKNIQDIERDGGKPIVDAAGKIFLINEKFTFSVESSTCIIRHSRDIAHEMIEKRAAEIFGAERVKPFKTSAE